MRHRGAAGGGLALLVFSLAACATGAPPGLFVSPQVVALAKETIPGGRLVLEVADDGTVLRMEADVSPDVPLASVSAGDRENLEVVAPGGRVLAAVKQVVAGEVCYEVRLERVGETSEVHLRAGDVLFARDELLAPGEYPPFVESVARAVATGSLLSVERVHGPESRLGTDWRVTFRTPEGEILLVCLPLDGRSCRVLRRIDAEVQVAGGPASARLSPAGETPGARRGGPMKHVIREMALAHCKRGPSRCEACRAAAAAAPRWCLLDVDPPDRGMVQRRVIEVRTETGSEWREFDIVRTFADEAEARAYAREHGLDEALPPGE